MYKDIGKSNDPWFCSNCSTLMTVEKDDLLLCFSDSFLTGNEDTNDDPPTQTKETAQDQDTPSQEDASVTELPLTFNDSFFEQSETSTNVSSISETDEGNYLQKCCDLKERNPKNCFFTYININSVRYKLEELKPVVCKLQPVVFCIAETKIDSSFHFGQFIIDGYHLPFRRDRTAHGGGLLVYVRSDIPCRKIENNTTYVESISIEITINKTIWNIISVYKSPNKVTDNQFTMDMESICEKSTSMYDRILILGDLNYNLLDPLKSRPLCDLMDIFSLDNLIKEPTYISNHGPSLIDIAMTNKPNCFHGSAVIDIGSSDGHSLICAVAKIHMPKLPPKTINYRSYKQFNPENFRKDLQYVPFSVCDSFENPDDIQWAHNLLIKEILDEHAPMKSKKVRPFTPPFMNNALRKSIMTKTRLRNRFMKIKKKSDWEIYRLQRNKTTKIRRSSIKKYFEERCDGGPKNIHFYKTIKPFLSAKHHISTTLMIQNDRDLLTDPIEVANLMNVFFANIAENIGNDKDLPSSAEYTSTEAFVDKALNYHQNHPSVTNIKDNNCSVNFKFKHTDEKSVSKIIKQLDPKKATGFDKIPAKALIAGYDILAAPLTRLYNKCVDTSSFPKEAKKAEVIPIYKKENALLKKNHRPVSILPSTSKVLEKLMESDLNENWLNAIYNSSLSAFRTGYSCQHVLLDLVDKWRQAKESKQIPGLLLADLSKAFDSLPHSLILSKLKAYGMDYNSVVFLSDYLSDRHQRVKVGNNVSSWANINKGVPQGSILGPIVFNIYMNDIFTNINDGILFNYADDNSILVTGQNREQVISKLTSATESITKWCLDNQMEANPSKFQALIADESEPVLLQIDENTEITSEPYVKLLGVLIDNKLSFNQHVSEVIKKSSRQLNCLKRVAYSLDTKTRLLLYKTFVSSNFNYCAVVWHNCGKSNTNKIEKIQHRALKFIYSDYKSDYQTLLSKANIPSLELARLRLISIEVFKIFHRISPPFLRDGFNFSTNRYNLRSGPHTMQRGHSRTTKFGLLSFRTFGTKVWNSLPAHIRDTTDFKTFRSLIKTWFGDLCKCNACKQI